MGPKPRAVREQISVQPMGDEMLLYDERRHMAFCLNPSAGVVWRLADGTRTITEIAADATAEMNILLTEEIVRLAVETLCKSGLLEESAAIPGDIATPIESRIISRRSMVRLGVGAAALLPVVASIVAPTAAQAYSGCVDCSVARPLRRGSAPPIAPSGDQ